MHALPGGLGRIEEILEDAFVGCVLAGLVFTFLRDLVAGTSLLCLAIAETHPAALALRDGRGIGRVLGLFAVVGRIAHAYQHLHFALDADGAPVFVGQALAEDAAGRGIGVG